jgi:hypothetical protein
MSTPPLWRDGSRSPVDQAPPGPASTTRLTPRRRPRCPWETIGQGIRPKPNGAPRSRAGLPVALAGRRGHQAGVRLVGRAVLSPQHHLPELLAGDGGALVSHEFPLAVHRRPHCRTWRIPATGMRASSNRCQISVCRVGRRWPGGRSRGPGGRPVRMAVGIGSRCGRFRCRAPATRRPAWRGRFRDARRA